MVCLAFAFLLPLNFIYFSLIFIVACGLQFPDQGWNLEPPALGSGSLNHRIGPPEKSQILHLTCTSVPMFLFLGSMLTQLQNSDLPRIFFFSWIFPKITHTRHLYMCQVLLRAQGILYPQQHNNVKSNNRYFYFKHTCSFLIPGTLSLSLNLTHCCLSLISLYRPTHPISSSLCFSVFILLVSRSFFSNVNLFSYLFVSVLL